MAMANIEIKCAVCGETFRHRKECRNASDRAKYEIWAAEHIDTCPACYKKQQEAIAASKLDAKLAELGIQLPEISGVSEKQVGYASDLRTKYLSRHMDGIDRYIKISANINDKDKMDKFVADCKTRGSNPDEEIEKAWKLSGLATVKLMMESNDARAIIDGYDRF